ncbi:ATP-binding protein [Dechloromonas sp. ZY10]|uniref:sensor histidine kinase n=1 Tax=Dechloromonas aquae TaxID=2664436 RepID=UPI0035275A26
MTPPAFPPPALRRPAFLAGAALALCLLLALLTYRSLFAYLLDQERQHAAQRLDALALSLDAALARHESLPGLLALDPTLSALLDAPRDPARLAAANAYLEAAQQNAQVAAAFLIDAEGLTLAASNWRQPLSFVGHNYAFRPYFRDAVEHGLGRFYGVGVTTGEPGYFLAAPIRRSQQLRGVIVLKIGLESLEQALANGGDPLLLADADGIVFLASARRLRYRSLTPLPEQVLARLRDSKQYGEQAPPLLADRPLPAAGLSRLALPEERPRERLVHSRPVGKHGWRLVQLGDPGEARTAALAAATATAFACAFALGLAAHLRQRARRREELRRIHASLETRIAERTADLTAQIAALERTKAILRETRDAAVQTGKLATLGQMAAGISHELNQPLAALQTLADNAQALLKRNRLDEAAENLQLISDLVGRTGRIVRQLKSFARKEAPTPQPVSVDSAIEHALLIVEPRRRELGASIHVPDADPARQVIAEAGRVEQILINLLRNALDAVADHAAPRVEVSCRRNPDDGSRLDLCVRDDGPGLSDEARHHLFEPFFTTKPAGAGLGLGLAISQTIAESYGGTLSARNAPGGGAEFVLTLPAVSPEGDSDAAPDA